MTNSAKFDSAQSVISYLPGYAMGIIVPTTELEIPNLKREIASLESEKEKEKGKVDNLNQEVRSINNRSDLSEAEKLQQRNFRQKIANQCQMAIRELESSISRVHQKIRTFERHQEEEKDSSSVGEMLPIDHNLTKLVIVENRSNESENMHSIVVKQDSTQIEFDLFASHLTGMQYLPRVVELVNQIAQTILYQAKEQNQSIFLLGSFITLARERVLDPIIVREQADISDNLLKKADRYSVICQTVLGGVFIGFTAILSKDQEVEKHSFFDKKEIELLSSGFHTFSFVSQGAIPPPSQTFSLWDTYNNWKKKLLEDKNSGFPIAYKVRNLKDILQEKSHHPGRGNVKH